MESFGSTFLADFSDPFPTLPWGTVTARLLAAALLGGLIGIDREVRTKPAGLRTHMLISLAACLFALIGLDLLQYGSPARGEIRIDPFRLIEAVTAGVAFLAAGSIITSRGKVKGLTTGAGMWMAGAVGLACGVGNLPLAGLASVLAVVILALVRLLPIEGEPDD